MHIIGNIHVLKKSFIFLVIILTAFFLVKISLFAGELETKEGYILYEERVEKICEPYKPEKTIFNTEEYTNIEEEENNLFGGSKDYFSDGKKLYKKNMNNIYKCMILNSGIKSLKLVKEDLIKNNPELNKKVEKKILEKIKKLKFSFSTLGCKNINEKNESIQKLILLKQTTFELCKYHSYLEYLREYSSDFNNLVLDNDDSYDTNYIVELETKRKNEIDNEITHIYKIFPIAFSAYNQYENNLTVHILLELIKEDYMVFREALHKSLNPINQVVYKISNAMKLD